MSLGKFLLLQARNPGDEALEHEQLAFREIHRRIFDSAVSRNDKGKGRKVRTKKREA